MKMKPGQVAAQTWRVVAKNKAGNAIAMSIPYTEENSARATMRVYHRHYPDCKVLLQIAEWRTREEG